MMRSGVADDDKLLGEALALVMPPRTFYRLHQDPTDPSLPRQPRPTNALELILAVAEEDRLTCPALQYSSRFFQRPEKIGVVSRSMEMLRRLEAHRKEILQKREEEELATLSPRPTINPKSQGMAKSNREEGFYQAGLSWKKAQKKKLDKKNQQRQKEIDEENEEAHKKWVLSERNKKLALRRKARLDKQFEELNEQRRANSASARRQRAGGEDEEEVEEDEEEEDEEEAATLRPPALWDPKVPETRVLYPFSPEVDRTSAIIHERRVTEGKWEGDCLQRLLTDAQQREETRRTAMTQTTRHNSPGLKLPVADIERVVQRVASPNRRLHEPYFRKKVPLPAEVPTFKPEIHRNPYKPVETLDMERIRRWKSEQAREARRAEWTKFLESHHNGPPMTPSRLQDFLTNNSLFIQEKEVKLETARIAKQAEADRECSFTPKVTPYKLSESYLEFTPTTTTTKASPFPAKPSGSPSSSAASPPPRGPTSTKRVTPFIPTTGQLLHRDAYSFVHDKELLADMSNWFAEMDTDRVGWISPGAALQACKLLAESLGCQLQYVDVDSDFPRRINFSDFVLMLNRSVRLPIGRNKSPSINRP
jgi:hypothetical protein